jgi:hypothetical protein
MESNKNLVMNKAMLWGFFVALASMIITSIFYATDNMFSPAGSWVSFVIYIAGIILVTLSYKKAIDEKTPFPYSKALGLGVATLFFASIILALFNFVLYTFIDPGLIEEGIAFAESKLLEKGFSEEMIEQQMEMQRKFMTPIIMSIMEIFSLTFYGLIISLITSIFLKKKQESGFDAAMNEVDDEE